MNYMEIHRLQRLFIYRHVRNTIRNSREPTPCFSPASLSAASSADELPPTSEGGESPAVPADGVAEAPIPPAAVPAAPPSEAATPSLPPTFGIILAGDVIDGAAIPEVAGDLAAQAGAEAAPARSNRRRRPRRPLVQPNIHWMHPPAHVRRRSMNNGHRARVSPVVAQAHHDRNMLRMEEPFHHAARNLYENNDPNSSAFYGYIYRRRFH